MATDPALESEFTPVSEVSSLESQQSGRALRPSLGAPLRLRTHDATVEATDSIDGPPLTLSRNSSSSVVTSSENLGTVSPKAERLPSFRQLSRIASAGEEEPRASPTYPPPPSTYHTSASSHSPVAQQQHQQQHFSHPPQMSPAPVFGYPQMSPSSVQNDPYYSNSPPSATFSSSGYYAAPTPRRPSTAYPPPPASLRTLSSTNSSGSSGLSHQSSMTEVYSTANTTPLETSNSNDSASRLNLPPPSTSMPPPATALSGTLPGSFGCNYPGCTAPPFQTQYLLNSHANVHSSDRPHYCPVAGCPRAEGGKGFKRKNEMIRHGLVHDSPGYMCPFCPDREHRYPRPDNLQRHVRVHHIDKDKDDPALREVLNQRAEGTNKGRRRRTGP